MQALLAFFFFTTGLVTVSGMSVRLRLTAVVVIVAVMAESE